MLAPSTPQEMLDLTMLAFELSFKYRNPVVLLGDGYLGQMTGRVELPKEMVKPGLPEWAVSGDRAHRGNLICSIYLAEPDLEAHNQHLNRKYAEIARNEQRADLFRCDDAEVLLVALQHPGAHGQGRGRDAAQRRREGRALPPAHAVAVPDRSAGTAPAQGGADRGGRGAAGQLEDELRLALSKAGLPLPPIDSVRHYGGVLPQQNEIVERVLAPRAAHAGVVA